MLLDYGTLLSEEPMKFPIGSIKPPTIGDIKKITFAKFQLYEVYLQITPEDFFSKSKDPEIKRIWENLSDEQKEQLTLFNMILTDKSLQNIYTEIFNFFFIEDVVFEENMFSIYDNGNLIGAIREGIFTYIIEVIQQFCGIYEKKESDFQDIPLKNTKTAKSIFDKIFKGKKKFKKNKEKEMAKNGEAKNWTLPNVYSSVANAHPSLNYSNMNGLTVYQLIDAFRKMMVNKKYEMAAHSVSVWGDEKKQFDDSLWYKNIYDKSDLFD